MAGGTPSRGRATPHLFAVDRLIHLILSQTDFFFPKKLYIYDPLRVLVWRAPQKYRNMKTEAATVKIGGGNSAGAAAGVISTFSNVFLVNTMIEGEYSTFGIHVCSSILIYFSLALHRS
jgi:hypothetical protein